MSSIVIFWVVSGLVLVSSILAVILFGKEEAITKNDLFS